MIPNDERNRALAVTGDTKCIYFEDVRRKNSWIYLRVASTSNAKLNRYKRKAMTYLCLWEAVERDPIMPGETVNTTCC